MIVLLFGAFVLVGGTTHVIIQEVNREEVVEFKEELPEKMLDDKELQDIVDSEL